MAVQVTVKSNVPKAVAVTGQPSQSTIISGTSKSARYQTWQSEDTHLLLTNVQDVLEELANRFYQRTAAPTLGINEGDLWYDLTASKLKLYNGSSWGLISGAANSLNDTYFKFTTSAALSSGNVAEFWNTTNKLWNLQHDGVMVLKNQTSEPTAVTNGVYVDGANMYLGVPS